MKIEIDQSGKVEYTSHKTVIAFSNEENQAILIPAKTKRELQEIFRQQGRPNLFMLKTFAAGIVLLIAEYNAKIQQVVIDQEYPSNERALKSMISEMLADKGLKIPEIYFKQIGKKSKAHYIAYGVFKNKRKPDKIINLKELANIAVK